MGLSNCKAWALFSVPGGLTRGWRRSGCMYLSFLRVRMDPKLYDLQTARVKCRGPHPGLPGWAALGPNYGPEVKLPLVLVQPPKLSERQGPSDTGAPPEGVPPKLSGSCQVPSPGGGRGSLTLTLPRAQHSFSSQLKPN